MSIAQVVTENGRQVVRMPDEIHLEGDAVSVKRVGQAVLLIPKNADRWKIMEAGLEEFTEDFMADRAQPTDAERRPPVE